MENTLKVANCKTCNKEFTPKTPFQLYCSRECRTNKPVTTTVVTPVVKSKKKDNRPLWLIMQQDNKI